MSYTPTEWKAGDTVTSAKLNKIEQGIASAGGGGTSDILIVHSNNDVLDKTWTEIRDANISFIVTKISEQDLTNGGSETDLIISTNYFDGEFKVITVSNKEYITDSIDGYPSYGW